MKDRNFVKEIEKLKTAVLVYDREEVVLYIKELVDYYEDAAYDRELRTEITGLHAGENLCGTCGAYGPYQPVGGEKGGVCKGDRQ